MSKGARRGPTEGEERRKAPRVLVDIEVDYALEDNYLFAYITDISVTGIFIRTVAPEPAGTRLNLRFLPPTAAHPESAREPIPEPPAVSPTATGRHQTFARATGEHPAVPRRAKRPESPPLHAFELEGEVIWVNPYRPGDPGATHPGMGIRFIALDDEDRHRLIELVRRFAYLT